MRAGLKSHAHLCARLSPTRLGRQDPLRLFLPTNAHNARLSSATRLCFSVRHLFVRTTALLYPIGVNIAILVAWDGGILAACGSRLRPSSTPPQLLLVSCVDLEPLPTDSLGSERALPDLRASPSYHIGRQHPNRVLLAPSPSDERRARLSPRSRLRWRARASFLCCAPISQARAW
jgi:hypothetical protein